MDKGEGQHHHDTSRGYALEEIEGAGAAGDGVEGSQVLTELRITEDGVARSMADPELVALTPDS